MPHLPRKLQLHHLILYGVVIIQPTAPMAIYGVVQQETRGHAVVAILIAMAAMLLTAFSYGRMASVYPSAGSAYSYVSSEFHPRLGFLTGWSLLLDYLINPMICVIWCSKAALNIAPGIPYAVWTVAFAFLFTWLNMRGVESSARWDRSIATILSAVVLTVLGAAFSYVGAQGANFVAPFYQPESFSWSAISTGSAVAVLTFIGFDAISTRAEEVHDPRRNILRATVGTCLIIGVLSALEVYAAQLVWPDYKSVPDIDTAYVHIAGRAGGTWLFHTVNSALLLATVGSGAAALLAASRLLYGMGRDGRLPQFFAALHPVTGIPYKNVLLGGCLALAGAQVLSFQLGAELLNFGAFIAFIGVNASALNYARRHERTLQRLLVPGLGLVVCAYVWLSLRPIALWCGFSWLACGLVYTLVRARRMDRPRLGGEETSGTFGT